MKVTYKNTLEQISIFNLYTFTRSPHSKRNIINGRMFVLIFTVLTVIYAVFNKNLENIDKITIICFICLVGILWYFLFPKLYRGSIKDEVKAKYKHKRLKLHEICIEYKDGAFYSNFMETNTCKLLDENALTAVVFAENMIYLITKDENESLIIPHCAFNNENDKVEFINQLISTFDGKVKIENGIDK